MSGWCCILLAAGTLVYASQLELRVACPLPHLLQRLFYHRTLFTLLCLQLECQCMVLRLYRSHSSLQLRYLLLVLLF